ncbi:MAG: hypothetical protein ACFFD4_22465 [Candidatus Odinarchaeota archaeon]
MPDYRCPVCQKEYSKPKWLLNHLEKHSPDRSFFKKRKKLVELVYTPLDKFFE